MSRHEQAERQAVEEVATDYLKVGVFIALAIGVIFVVGGPWVEFHRYGHEWGWAILGVLVDLLAALIAVAVIAGLIKANASKRS
jgi:hypothetical protein